MKAITEEVADPVVIAQEVHNQIQADQEGREYAPKVTLNTDACVRMIAIASGMDEDDIGEMFMEHGVMAAQGEAGNFLAALLGADAKEVAPGKN